MNRVINFGLIFKNRVGIVSQVSKQIYDNNGNILNSNMIKIGNHFAFDITASVPHDIDSSIFINLDNNYEPTSLTDDYYNTKLKIYSADNPGIIHSTCKKLEIMGADITKLNSDLLSAPFTNTPIFSMDLQFNIDRKYSISKIKESLEDVTEKFNCDLEI